MLFVGHFIGTIFGVSGATSIEMHLNLALKDNKVDDTEKLILGKDFFLTRIGMALTLITGAGFVFERYQSNTLNQFIDGVFWAKMLIVVIIIVNAYLLHKHKIGLYWGSAFSFVSWWSAMIIGAIRLNGFAIYQTDFLATFSITMAMYAFLVIIGASILHKLRNFGKVQPQVQVNA